MTGEPVPLRIAEPAGWWRRSLRRFTFTSQCPGARRGHDACAVLGDIPAGEACRVHGDNWPRDDPRWPAACEGCGYEFTVDDQWQRNDDEIFRLPDGTTFAYVPSLGRAAPAGTMIRAAWYDEHTDQPGESWIIALPDGGQWITTQRGTDGGYWTVTGTAPALTAVPSIFHNAPHGWHGYLTDGYLRQA